MPRRQKKSKEQKSQQIQFRLNPDNRDDAVALDIIAHWEKQGYGKRYIMTAALLALEGYDLPPIYPDESESMQLFRDEVIREMRKAISSELDGIEIPAGQNAQVDNSNVARSSIPSSRKGKSKTAQFAAQFQSIIQPGEYADE